MIGAEAALLLLEEMKMLPNVAGVSPDIFTYTTVISGVARAEVSLNSNGRVGHGMHRSIGKHIYLYPPRCDDGTHGCSEYVAGQSSTFSLGPKLFFPRFLDGAPADV